MSPWWPEVPAFTVMALSLSSPAVGVDVFKPHHNPVYIRTMECRCIPPPYSLVPLQCRYPHIHVHTIICWSYIYIYIYIYPSLYHQQCLIYHINWTFVHYWYEMFMVFIVYIGPYPARHVHYHKQSLIYDIRRGKCFLNSCSKLDFCTLFIWND